MEYSPEGQKKKASVMSLLLAAAGLILFLMSRVTPYPIILQGTAVALFVASIFILIRYRFTNYLFRVKENNYSDGEDHFRRYDFEAQRQQGTRPYVTECLMALDQIVCTERISRDDSLTAFKNRIIKKYGSVAFYFYTVSMSRPDRYAMIFDDDGVISCVVIETSDEMKDLIDRFVPERGEEE